MRGGSAALHAGRGNGALGDVTAQTDALLYGLDKGSFLHVLTGHRSARSAADGAIAGYDDPDLYGIVNPEP